MFRDDSKAVATHSFLRGEPLAASQPRLASLRDFQNQKLHRGGWILGSVRVTTTSRNIIKTWSQFQPNGRENGEIMALASLGWWGFLGSATWFFRRWTYVYQQRWLLKLFGDPHFLGGWVDLRRIFDVFFLGRALTQQSPQSLVVRGDRGACTSYAFLTPPMIRMTEKPRLRGS